MLKKTSSVLGKISTPAWVLIVMVLAVALNIATLTGHIPVESVLITIIIMVLVVATFQYPVVAPILFTVSYVYSLGQPGLRMGVMVFFPATVAAIVAYSGRKRLTVVVTLVMYLLGFISPSSGIPGVLNPTRIYFLDLPALGTWTLIFALGVTAGWILGKSTREEQRLLSDWRTKVSDRQEEVARTLHDSVAASLTSVIMQSEALSLSPSNDVKLNKQLESIAESGRNSMTQLRELLNILDAPEPDPTDAAATLANILLEMNGMLLKEGFDPVIALELAEADVRAPNVAVLRGVTHEAIKGMIEYGDRRHPVTVRLASDDDDLVLITENRTAPVRVSGQLDPGSAVQAMGKLAATVSGSVISTLREDLWVNTIRIPM